MYWEQAIQQAARTDIGLRRQNNEDALAVHLCGDPVEWHRRGHLLIVADGMGGHAVGELASQIAVETIPHSFLKSKEGDAKTALARAIVEANSRIHEKGTQNQDFLNMGTTCTALALTPRGAIIGHVGDSRAYRLRRDRVDQLTFDHSLEWELERRHGNSRAAVDLSQHRNIITRSLGPERVVDVDIEGPFIVLPGDSFVVCSDGLSNQVTDEEIGAVVRELSPEKSARLLIHLANIRGGPDNSTVIVARVGELPANVAPPPELADDEEDSAMDWSWLAGFWLLAMLFVAGVAVFLFRNAIAGASLSALSGMGLVALSILALKRGQQLETQYTEDSRTNLWRPHRTAVALSSRELYERLTQIEVELQTAARTDGWKVSWSDHASAMGGARTAAREKRFARAVDELGRAIDALMTGVPRTADEGGAKDKNGGRGEKEERSNGAASPQRRPAS